MRQRPLAISLFILCAPIIAWSQSAPLSPNEKMPGMIEGKVTAVTNGDQLTVKTRNGRSYFILLHGIDAPEAEQDFGAESNKALSQLVMNRIVSVVLHRETSKGQYMGTVFYEGQDIGLRLLEIGSAWHYKRVSGEQSSDARATYALAELKAREARAGLWADQMPIPPWEFRDEFESKEAAVEPDAAPAKNVDAAAKAAQPSSEDLNPGRVYMRGPRGGCYYLNAAGAKVYVKDKDLCPKP